MRQCVACRVKSPQSVLLKLKLIDGVVSIVDKRSGFTSGRGCYTCRKEECLELALKKGSFARAFRCKLVVLPTREALLNGLETEGIMNDDDDR